jgi:hypothetical protein
VRKEEKRENRVRMRGMGVGERIAGNLTLFTDFFFVYKTHTRYVF